MVIVNGDKYNKVVKNISYLEYHTKNKKVDITNYILDIYIKEDIYYEINFKFM